jgi:hypothetical protein
MNNNAFKISLTYDQVLDLVRQMPKKDKARLSTELAKEAVDARLSRLLNAFKTNEISEDEINREVEEAKTEIYAKKQKN